MATCVHCGKAKGQRACPALAGEICARCCGKHRLAEIACPSDCRWLGGLAVLAAEGPQRFTPADEDAAFRKLVAFTELSRELPHGRAAFSAMLGLEHRPSDDELVELTEAIDPHTAAAITSHLAFGHRADDGTRAVDRMITAHGRDLSRGEAAAMRALQGARGVIATVSAVQVGVGMVLRDRVAGGHLTVGAAASDVPPMGTTLFLWLVDHAGTLTPTGPMVVIPKDLVDAAIARVRAEHDAIPAEDSAARRRALAAAAPHVFAVLREAAPAAEAPLPGAGEPAPAT